MKFLHFGRLYWIRYFDFSNSECKFVTNDLDTPRVPIFIEIEEFSFPRAFGSDRKIFLAAQLTFCACVISKISVWLIRFIVIIETLYIMKFYYYYC